MRHEFCQALLDAADDPELVFLTGDLGYKALEPLREKLAGRFINAGVAEQNMVAVAAGLARAGMKPWAYSIAPFIYARPFEQIRNDACLHDLPVRLIGNGGGYGYGVMGATHHALEDYGALLTLPHLQAFVPAFGADVGAIVRKLDGLPHPAYLRLGLAEEPDDLALPPYAPWRRIIEGGGATVIGIGPVISPVIAAVRNWEGARRPNVWVVSELPVHELPLQCVEDVVAGGHLVVVEEHVAHGGLGQILCRELVLRGKAPARFTHHCAAGYLSGRYGSQKFHRRESRLDAESILASLI